MEDLPKEFDIIVVGTGMVESIVSGAASRIGKRVLHLDKNDYYGSLFASFNLDSIMKLTQQKERDKTANIPLNQTECSLEIGNDLFELKDFSYKWHIPDESSKLEETEAGNEGEKIIENYSKDDVLKLSRKFNIDLCPKLQFARGDFVELLISSNVARYVEYRSVSRVLTWLNDQLEIVPCSRSDVFTNNKVSVIEKRMLMKLFTSLEDEESILKEYEGKTFKTFLKDKKLSANLIHYVLHAIARSTDETSCAEGIKSTKRFLTSLGRFGKTPFLYCLYGSGDLPQAFCRLSALFGGIYALDQPLKQIILDNGKFKSIVCGEQRLSAEHLVINLGSAPKSYIDKLKPKYISRAVLVTDKSIMASEQEHLTLMLYPAEENKKPITLMELGCLTGTCPSGYYLIHLMTEQTDHPESDFEKCLTNMFNFNLDLQTTKPTVLWSAYYSIPVVSELSQDKTAENVWLSQGPDFDLDYDGSVKEAKKLFDQICPGAEFMVRAPDPEEIVFDGEDEGEKEEAKPEDLKETEISQEAVGAKN